MHEHVRIHAENSIATISLNDPQKRNALGLAMFDALEAALARVAGNESIHVVLLTGEGDSFCAGFDLAAAANDPTLVATFITRLSLALRAVRRLPQVVVAAVPGPAIAGGCALLSACDFVFVAPDASLGYPVHRLGVSPAVTIPTLQQALKSGPARALLMSGQLIDGRVAHRLGLATHVAQSQQTVRREAMDFCKSLTTKGVHALRTTKAWLNELDKSLDDGRFDGAAEGSAAVSVGREATSMLAAWWSSARQRREHEQ